MNNREKAQFADAFLETYLLLGLGALSKTEIDTLVFHLLTETGEYRKCSNYELATRFKVSETRIKNLRLAAALKYREINPKAVLGDVVLRTLDGKQALDVRGGKVEIALENPIEKRELENFLKVRGHSAEYTLNNEVLRIEPIRLLELMVDNLERAEEHFSEVVAAAVDDQAASDQILGGGSTARMLTRFRQHVSDADAILRVCKGLAGVIAAT